MNIMLLSTDQVKISSYEILKRHHRQHRNLRLGLILIVSCYPHREVSQQNSITTSCFLHTC